MFDGIKSIIYQNNYFYITGHGNITFSNEEIAILRDHLLNGAFLHVDDNYGLNKSFRKVLKQLFPEKELVELPKDHSIFHCYFKFDNGLPKIHEHDNQSPQAVGLFDNHKLILLYTFESDLGAKGAGEAGTAGAPAAIMNALNDALMPFDVRLTRQPFTPQKVLEALGKI